MPPAPPGKSTLIIANFYAPGALFRVRFFVCPSIIRGSQSAPGKFFMGTKKGRAYYS